MKKNPRPYQQEAINKLKLRLKETSEPLLVNASVGSGKSLILSEILLAMEKAKYPSLCLTMNSTLIEQNSETYRLQGGNPGIYCAALNSKETNKQIIFASPHSVVKSFPNIDCRLIVIDECHNINFDNEKSMYMRVIQYYRLRAQEKNYNFRIIGLTGTPYRGKGVSIVGKDKFFKEEVCSISTSWLISQDYLVKPRFGVASAGEFDFSALKVNKFGNFNEKELQKVIDKNERLTGKIMREVSGVIDSGRNGAFIFASTRKHCEECARSLPDGQWAIITGETPHSERKEILSNAKSGNIKYLISVNCLNVGVDVPNFDVCVWVRPTESLILYTQGIGRVLRLHPEKNEAIVLDYAGNLERHGDIDDPIINEALKPTKENEKDYVIKCYTCGTHNTICARRCIGNTNNKRCSYFFVFKPCHACNTENDTTSRHCRECKTELVDPNAKLRFKEEEKEIYKLKVERVDVFSFENKSKQAPSINVSYWTNKTTSPVVAQEYFYTGTERAKNITYANFFKAHYDNPSKFYTIMHNPKELKKLMKTENFKIPYEIWCRANSYGQLKVIKKLFHPIE